MLAIFTWMVYTILVVAGVMELVDVVDSKSTDGDIVPVRVRPPAPSKKTTRLGGLFLLAPVAVKLEGRSSLATSLRAAGGRCSAGAVCAAVYKIEGKRKSEDFIGHRKRTQAPRKARP